MKKIVIDAFGGDNSPGAQVEGAVKFLSLQSDYNVILSGDEQLIRSELKKYKHDPSRVEVVHASQVITNEESPTMAIRSKKDSSLVKALQALKEDPCAEGMLSSGSTGAILAGGIFKLGRIEGVLRPALASQLPTKGGGRVCLIDCGANVDCRSDFLEQFTLMAVCYLRSVYGIQNPRVGLVSVGVEDHKGNALTKETFELLKKLPINFLGNMEARDALSGEYDILVADGFIGNVLLKSVEGAAQMLMGEIKGAITESSSAKFGYLFMKKAFKKIKTLMNYHSYGGAPLLGVNKVLVKAHGAANADSVLAALMQVKSMVDADLVGGIKREMESLTKAHEGEQEPEPKNADNE